MADYFSSSNPSNPGSNPFKPALKRTQSVLGPQPNQGFGARSTFKISSSSSSFSRNDRVGDDEGTDTYRFELTRTSKVKISVENKEFIFGPSLDFKLLDSKGKKIKSREVDGLDSETIDRTLNKGTYSIRVESDGESVPYKLKYKRTND